MPQFSIPKPDLKQSDTVVEEENEDEFDNQSNHSHSFRHRTTRSSGRGVTTGDVEDEGLAPPPSPPRSSRTTPPPPPPPEAKGIASWEFFFPSMENVPGPTLAEVEENIVERLDNDIERKVFEEERSNTGEDNAVGGKAEAEAEVELPPESPAVKAVKKVRNVGPADGKRIVKSVPSVSLLQIFSELDDCFLKGSESAHEVSKMLEATRLHYHSNFADNRGRWITLLILYILLGV